MAQADLELSPTHKSCAQCVSPRSGFNVLPWKPLRSRVQLSKELFGCISPLDRICGSNHDRAKQLGLTPKKDPYFQNQSFPCVYKGTEIGNDNLNIGAVRQCSLDKFKGDSLNSFSFSPNHSKRLFSSTMESTQTLNESWVFSSHVEGGNSAVRNPNKAVVTINTKTTEILVANKMACVLLGLNSKLHGARRLCEFFVSRKDQYSLSEVELKYSGELIVISGKVMDLVSSEKNIVPVSVWAKHLDTGDEDPRCVVIMEPVERITGNVTFDQKGKILNCDKNFASLYGYLFPQDLNGVQINNLIPCFILPTESEAASTLPKEIRKQCATGRTKEGTIFPVSILISPYIFDNSAETQLSDDDLLKIDGTMRNLEFTGTVWVFANISGMITVLPDGIIHSCNSNFSLMLFGYSQNQLVGKSITTIIPSFYGDLEFLDADSLDGEAEDCNARCCASNERTTKYSLMTDPPRPANPLGKQEHMVDDDIKRIQNIQLNPLVVDSEHNLCHGFQNVSTVKAMSHPFETPLDESDNDQIVLELEDSHTSLTQDLYLESSQSAENLRNLSNSESQNTLHSIKNSITESDINANILENSDLDEGLKSPGTPKSDKSSSCWKKAEKTSDQYSSDSVYSDEDNISSFDNEEVKFERSASLNFNTPSKPASSCSITSISEIKLCNLEKEEDLNNCISSIEKIDINAHLPIRNSMIISTPRENAFPERQTDLMTSYNSEVSSHSIPEGNYFGVGLHRDGSDLAIVYHIRKVELDDGKLLYCLWVSKDREEPNEVCRPYKTLTLGSSLNNPLGQNFDSGDQLRPQESFNSHSSSSTDVADSIYIAGCFSENYTILQQIGKGAFGCVKKAYRNSDGLLVITKFIRKSKIYKELWVHDNFLNHRVPLEVSLLNTVDHPNIVQVLDVFENEEYFQMIMEKHGAGMDLFEFIDRDPRMDETLASYIFRQVVSALSYLHDLNIIHRDIKDENIILDQHFHVKLIDFGSATFMGSELFSTFCGTMEYCSPEVIQGEKYRGPELEMWALGVTLYTLIFGENPFIDVEETIKAELRPLNKITTDLIDLIRHLLEPDPVKRCSLAEAKAHPWSNQPIDLEKYNFADIINATSEEINPPKYVEVHQGDTKLQTFDDDMIHWSKSSVDCETCCGENPSNSSSRCHHLTEESKPICFSEL